jgi:hypothetical protein
MNRRIDAWLIGTGLIGLGLIGIGLLGIGLLGIGFIRLGVIDRVWVALPVACRSISRGRRIRSD